MSSSAALPTQSSARVYLVSQQDGLAVVSLPDTQYQLHLKTLQPLVPNAQNRVHGLIRCPVWKVDQVRSGGSYIEPIMGRPRRLQGRVLGPWTQEPGSLLMEICRTQVIAQLPDRWNPVDFKAGEKLAIEVFDGSTFEQI